MDWITHKYIGIISSRLQKFKRKGPNLYNFRCPICNDSASNKNKARGYIYEKNQKMQFHCHNCGATMNVATFFKTIDLNVYNEYKLEQLRERTDPKDIELVQFTQKLNKPKFLQSGPLKNLKKISQLHHDHPMKQYVVNRKIPTPYHAKLFCCPNFMSFTNELIPGKFDEDVLQYDETRLLIPFFNQTKDLHAYQGRSMSPDSKSRYISIILDESVPKVYGLDTVDFSERTYVFEGPIDSMFIPNSVAAAGGDLVPAIRHYDKNNIVIVHDNEPRHKDTVKKVQKDILQGYNVCIWPESMEYKDINDMFLAGLSPDYIKHVIDTNTFKDLRAKLHFSKWCKIDI